MPVHAPLPAVSITCIANGKGDIHADAALGSIVLERVMGIEPTLAAWEAAVLPLNYTREAGKSMPAAVGGAMRIPPAGAGQNEPPTVMNTLRSLPPFCSTVRLVPAVTSSPISLLRTPRPTVP